MYYYQRLSASCIARMSRRCYPPAPKQSKHRPRIVAALEQTAKKKIVAVASDQRNVVPYLMHICYIPSIKDEAYT